MRQEHFARTEQIADDIHAVHQRAFDNFDRATACGLDGEPRFLGIVDNMRVDALDQSMFEAFLDFPAAPLGLCFLLRYVGAAIFFGQRNQPFGSIGVAV